MNKKVNEFKKKAGFMGGTAVYGTERLYTTNMGYDYKSRIGEVNTGQSLTIPDQAIALSDLVVRYARGEDVPQYGVHYQDDDDDQEYPDIRQMDLSDVYEMREHLNARAKELRKELKGSQELAERQPVTPVKDSGDEGAKIPGAPKETQATKEGGPNE